MDIERADGQRAVAFTNDIFRLGDGVCGRRPAVENAGNILLRPVSAQGLRLDKELDALLHRLHLFGLTHLGSP